MKTLRASAIAVLLAAGSARAQVAPPDLTGLWAATIPPAPDISGRLLLLRNATLWRADIAGFSASVRVSGHAFSFDLPDRKGSFRGTVDGAVMHGQWVGTRSSGNGTGFGTAVTLTPNGANRWQGDVKSLEEGFTLFLPVTRQPDGSYRTFLRNPERNIGRFIPVSRIEMNGNAIKLTGGRRNQPEETQGEGRYEDGVMHLVINGTSFDFTKVDDDTTNAFYPRSKSGEKYHYMAPVQRADGWPVASLDDVGIARTGIEKLVQTIIDTPMDSASSLQLHSVLIARHGKLVLEEYFHGYHRDAPHDVRSAGKSLSAILIGAAMHAGVPVALNTPVYQTMLGSVPPDLDARKRTMTFEHLISMTAGYNCADDEAPGNEDIMQQQREDPDWYHYTLNVPMLTAPGDTIVYCSIEPNLALGMLHKISGEPLLEMFDRLVARPMQLSNYHLFLSPKGELYGAGGHRMLPRDFMKLAQLMLNDGKWAGQQIISGEWARKSASPLRTLWAGQQYGWLWNSAEYPYQARKVRGFFAAGNGGQIFMAIPELDLVVGFTAGNYNDAAAGIPTRVFLPQFILPAVK